MDLCYVEGKRGRQVAILLPPGIIPAMQTLIDHRQAIGIPENNIYMFAAPSRNSENALRGYQCIGTVISKVKGIEKPEAIKSINLRKYMATVAQIADLKGNELEWLANHLGHDVNIHKEYYRLRDSTLELAKVSRLLLAVDNGKGRELNGKKFDDINIDDEMLNTNVEKPGAEDADDEESNTHFRIEAQQTVNSVKSQSQALDDDDIDVDKLEEPPRKPRRTWKSRSKNEVKVVLREFHPFIVGKGLPGKIECERVISEHPEIAGRSWSQVKDYVRNYKAKLDKVKK